ncbi:MAG: phosphoglycerate kinase [Bacillota bacterium]|nr:phosphoglycerate kinase [Bacillota bacterium]
MEINMLSLDDFNYTGKAVLLRVDINSPVDPKTRRIANDNRIRKSLPTIRHLLDAGACLALIAHQGDTLDYQNLMPLAEHAALLSRLLGQPIAYIDDVCGPAACATIQTLQPGEAVLLGNLRYLTEEVSGFEKEVRLEPAEMLQTWLVRSLAPLFDYYVNDAFAAAHRNSPSMVAFQELLPTAGGRLLYQEYAALSRLLRGTERPVVFLLGGAKISDAFGMLRQVLERGIADCVLTCGVTGQVFLTAAGRSPGRRIGQWIEQHDLSGFVAKARTYLDAWGDRILMPADLACIDDGSRLIVPVTDMPRDDLMFGDIGPETCSRYTKEIQSAGTIFVNGPAGIYEEPLLSEGTRLLWRAVAEAPGYSVIGGGDTVLAASRFTGLDVFSYVCTAGGAMVRFLSGDRLPLVAAMEKAWLRDHAH